MTTHRIESLSDCIFAFSMTLLVMNFNFPDINHPLDEKQVAQVLFKEISKLDHYILTFVLLAIFWVTHHQQFHHIKRTDRCFLWIQIATLMFIVMIPFTAAWMSSYNHLQVTNLIFDINLFILGLLFFSGWHYATYSKRLVDESLDTQTIMKGKARSLLTLAISMLAMALTFYHPDWSNYTYILIPVLSFLKPFRMK